MHLADTFIQSDLLLSKAKCIQAIHLYYQNVWSLGIEPTAFALLYPLSHRNTNEQYE